MRYKLPALLFLGLSLLVGIYLFLYVPALSFPYQFDDFGNILENRSIRYLRHPSIFLEAEQARNRPLTSLTFALSYYWSGLSLSALRWPSYVLHFLNAIFVGLFFYRSFSRADRRDAPAGAFLAGGIFLLHPLAVDSVIYFSGRSSLLVLFFLLAALWYYGRLRPGPTSWGLFTLAALGAFLSKESAVALLPLLLIYHLFLGRRARELVPYVLPLLVGGVGLAILKWPYLVGVSRGTYQIGGEVNIYYLREYWMLALAQWPRILQLFVRPDLLAIDHQVTVPASLADFHFLGGVLLWLTVPFLVWALRRRPSAPIFFALWIFASLSVTNSIVPVLDPLAERHLYLALPAVAWIVAALALYLTRRLPAWAWIAPLAVALVLVVPASAKRIEAWRSQDSLWASARALYPQKFRVVYNSWMANTQLPDHTEAALPILLDYLATTRPGTISYEEQELAVRGAAGVVNQLARERGGDPWRAGEEILGRPIPFWGDLILLVANLRSPSDGEWLRHWEAAVEKSARQSLARTATEPNWINNSFYLLRARYFVERGERKAAIADYERVFREFTRAYFGLPGVYFPYWILREELGDLYLAEGRAEDGILQYRMVANEFRGMRRFPYSVYAKLSRIFLARKETDLALDAMSHLLRVRSDDAELRHAYAALLREKGSKAAMRQTREAEFFSEHAVPVEDPREAIRY